MTLRQGKQPHLKLISAGWLISNRKMLHKLTDSGLISFNYSSRLDRNNLLLMQEGEPEYSRKIREYPESLQKILDESQSHLLYEKRNKEISIYPINVYLLKSAIIVEDSYELFWAPWLADGSYSYPTEGCRKEWKLKYQSAHNAINDSRGIQNLIKADRFAQVKNILSGNAKVCVKSHKDSDNYWHWTFEWVPRLIQIKKFLINKSIDTRNVLFFSIGSKLNRFQQEWMNMIFPGVQVASFSNGIYCNNLIWANISFSTHHSKQLVGEISDYIVDNHCQTRSQGRKNRVVFIERGKSKNGRNILNSNKLKEVLRNLGIPSFELDGLNVSMQAKLFRNSELVIGAHGSAFVNMIYCSPGTRILEIFGPGYIPGHDLILADSCGLDWDCMIGNSSGGITEFHSDFWVDIDKFKKIVMKKGQQDPLSD